MERRLPRTPLSIGKRHFSFFFFCTHLLSLEPQISLFVTGNNTPNLVQEQRKCLGGKGP